MSTFRDFRGLEIPHRAFVLGFIDESWHNDAAARMTRDFGHLTATLWIGDEYSVEEIGGTRYELFLDETNYDEPGTAIDPVSLCRTNDLARVLDAADHLVRFIAEHEARTLEWVTQHFRGAR